MKKSNRSLLGLFSIALLLAACNIYSPFETKGDVTAYLEEAQRCLHERNYDCAIQNYNLLPDGNQKNEKLCLAYLSKAGFGIDALLNIVTQKNSQMLGTLAQALSPWNATKGSDAATSRTYCAAVTGESAVLLSSVSYSVDCAVRISKADQFWGADEADETCAQTPPVGNGTLTKADISTDNTGVGAGMCKTDLIQCANDSVTMSNNISALNSSKLSDFSTALSKLPTELTTTAGTNAAAIQNLRIGIRNALSN